MHPRVTVLPAFPARLAALTALSAVEFVLHVGSAKGIRTRWYRALRGGGGRGGGGVEKETREASHRDREEDSLPFPSLGRGATTSFFSTCYYPPCPVSASARDSAGYGGKASRPRVGHSALSVTVCPLSYADGNTYTSCTNDSRRYSASCPPYSPSHSLLRPFNPRVFAIIRASGLSSLAR